MLLLCQSQTQHIKLHPFIGALGLLSLFIVPGDLIIQTVLDVAVDIARQENKALREAYAHKKKP